MSDGFSREFTVIWANLDPNRHMRHSAYNDYAAQLRLEFFEAFGFDLTRLMKLGIGPILFREETRFMREVHMGEKITVNIEIHRSRKDGSKWSIRHTITKPNGDVAAFIDVDGAWLDLQQRKTTVPPRAIAEIMINAPRTSDFEWIPEKAIPS
jgi:acyl-CoA thioester hydrolase